MADTVIQVENLGKKYTLSHQREGRQYKALRDVIAGNVKSIVRTANPFIGKSSLIASSASKEEFWALKDVSFEIKQGDRIGIIGRNGAGKSTLLKVLSRITEPTTGRIKIRGRVASLLEVGTGFHPELTGRENVYLNGAILGMSRVEIKRKFDEIVAFAEVERFLDTPVKRYSSGMYVRLAFAVAAHLEPEVLVVDEVLAVGDLQFQEKCLGKMESVSKEGRTVIFVSHNMGAIRALCDRGICFSKGALISDSSIDKAISHYIQKNRTVCESEYNALYKESKKPYFLNIKALQSNNQSNLFRIDKPIYIKFLIETYSQKNLAVGLIIRNSQELIVHHSSDEFSNSYNGVSSSRECILPPYALAPGTYYIEVSLGQRNLELFEHIVDAFKLEIEFVGAMAAQTMADDWKGVCGPGLLIWS